MKTFISEKQTVAREEREGEGGVQFVLHRLS